MFGSLLPISSWMLGGGGGGGGIVRRISEQEFLKDKTKVGYHCIKAQLNTNTCVLTLHFSRLDFSEEAEIATISLHNIDNHVDEYYDTTFKFNIKSDINVVKNYPLPPNQCQAYMKKKLWLILFCAKTKEVVNDVPVEVK